MFSNSSNSRLDKAVASYSKRNAANVKADKPNSKPKSKPKTKRSAQQGVVFIKDEKCPKCKMKKMVKESEIQKRGGDEAASVTIKCANCGHSRQTS